GAAVLEPVPRVVDAADAEGAALHMQRVARAEVEARGRMIAEQGAVPASADDHQPAVVELARVEAEDEEGAVAFDGSDPEVDIGGLVDPWPLPDLVCERVWQERLGEVGNVPLEEAEVRAADVDEVIRRVVDAGGDRQQRHDQPDADRDAGGSEGRSAA